MTEIFDVLDAVLAETEADDLPCRDTEEVDESVVADNETVTGVSV